MTKRFWAMCLTILLLLSLFTFSALADEVGEGYGDWYEDWANPGDPGDVPAEAQQPTTEPPAIVFNDVLEGDWFYSDVMALTEAKVIDGFGDGTFRPQSNVTTGQALKMILLASGHPTPEPVASHWARGYLNYALDAGILVRGEITDLDVNISRGLVAKIAALSLGLYRQDATQFFTDTNDDYIHALHEIGVVGGYSDNSFKPQRNLTRAELAAIVNRIYTYRNPPLEETFPERTEDDETLRTTEAGITFIKAVEGFVETPYWDYQQYSVGYGSRCEAHEYPNGITEAEADVLLREMIGKIETTLDTFLEKNGVALSDNQYDALVSFTYNTGTTWMRSSRLSKLLASGAYNENEFASAFGIWCHVQASNEPEIHEGLIQRRIKELKIFFDNDYTGNVGVDFCYYLFTTTQGEMEVDIGFYRQGSAFAPYFEATCAGDTFMGWQDEMGLTIDPNSIVTESKTLSALWEIGGGESGSGGGYTGDEGWIGWGGMYFPDPLP